VTAKIRQNTKAQIKNNEKIVENKNRTITTTEHFETHLKTLMCRFCEKLRKRKLSAWLTDSCAYGK